MSGRAPRGYTHEPCHGCGTTEMHAKGNLCSACKRGLEDLFLMRKRHGDGDKVPRLVPTHPNNMPYLGHQYENHSPRRDHVTRALFDLAILVSEPTDLKPDGSLFPNAPNARYTSSTPVVIDEKVAEALTRLHGAIHDTVRIAHATGHAEGRNLLARLAAGEITGDQFNDQALRREGKA